MCYQFPSCSSDSAQNAPTRYDDVRALWFFSSGESLVSFFGENSVRARTLSLQCLKWQAIRIFLQKSAPSTGPILAEACVRVGELFERVILRKDYKEQLVPCFEDTFAKDETGLVRSVVLKASGTVL